MVGVAALFAVSFFFLLLLAPGLTRPLLQLIPRGRMATLAGRIHEAAMAYSERRGTLLAAVGLAAFGHATTALMYWALLCAMSPGGEAAPGLLTVLFVALLMIILLSLLLELR